MKVYMLTFADSEVGFVRQFRRNKRECARLIREWEADHPLRQLLSNELVEIPDDKSRLIDWLNTNASKVPT